MIPVRLFRFFGKWWFLLSSSTSEVVTLVASVLPIQALFQFVDGNAAVTGGILRARGKQVMSC